MRYQKLVDGTTEWTYVNPPRPMQVILDATARGTVVTVAEPGIVAERWRVRPRDTGLVQEIVDLLTPGADLATNANAVYDLLEEKGLV